MKILNTRREMSDVISTACVRRREREFGEEQTIITLTGDGEQASATGIEFGNTLHRLGLERKNTTVLFHC